MIKETTPTTAADGSDDVSGDVLRASTRGVDAAHDVDAGSPMVDVRTYTSRHARTRPTCVTRAHAL